MEPQTPATPQPVRHHHQSNSSSRLVLVVLFLLIAAMLLRQGMPKVKEFFQNGFKNVASIPEKIVEHNNVTLVEEESGTISVVDKASPSVVSVVERSVSFDFFSGPQQTEQSIGTGFAVDKNLVVSNKHVVSVSSANYSVVDNAGKKYDVTKIYRDPLNDLSILEVKDANFPVLGLGDSDSVKIGQTAIAIGNALGKFSNTVTKGVISGKGRGITAGGLGQFQEEIENVLQTDAALNPGNSGGPLLNISSQVIGVNVAISEGSENIGFAIPSNVVKGLLDDFKAGVERRRPFLGIQYAIITKEFAENSDFPEGALVREVQSNSAASKAGLKVNDVITSIDGQAITENNLLAQVIAKKKVGDVITMKVTRDDKEIEVKATLEAAPEE